MAIPPFLGCVFAQQCRVLKNKLIFARQLKTVTGWAFEILKNAAYEKSVRNSALFGCVTGDTIPRGWCVMGERTDQQAGRA